MLLRSVSYDKMLSVPVAFTVSRNYLSSTCLKTMALVSSPILPHWIDKCGSWLLFFLHLCRKRTFL